MAAAESLETGLEAFRVEARDWLAKNFPSSLANVDVAMASAMAGIKPSGNAGLWQERMAEKGWGTPTWPKQYGGGGLSSQEAKILAQEMAKIGAKNPIGGMGVMMFGPTLLEYGNEAQKARHVPGIVTGTVRWCQGYSEPNAGSDLAALRTQAVDMGDHYLVNGQKVWTSAAHLARFGLATVRTNPDAPKHEGITTMVIDMHAPGVTVRPLQMPTGNSNFNEVFFDDVFVPDADVVGPVDAGWTVARATLGNESVSIGGGDGGPMTMPAEAFIAPLDAHPERLAGGAGRVGRQISRTQAMGVLNQRSAYRAVAGGDPGPEGNIAKLLLSEAGHETAAIMAELAGPDAAFLEGNGATAATLVLMNRAMSIAGGTSEIKRNQIAERILGLPRDPLIK